MQSVSQREALLERRHFESSRVEWWDKLSLAQKFAASSLTQFGYDLAFIRSSSAGTLAVLICDGKPATINSDGEIDTAPNIVVR